MAENVNASRSSQSDPLNPGGVAIIAHPDKQANKQRKASLIPKDEEDPDDPKAKGFIFDHPLTHTDFFISIIFLFLGGAILIGVTVLIMFTQKPKWKWDDVGIEKYQEEYQ